MQQHSSVWFALVATASCAASRTPPVAAPERPSAVGSASAPPVASSTAPAPPVSPTAALDAEIAALRACHADATSYDLRCSAHDAFKSPRTTPSTAAEEDLLLSLARGPRPMRLSALYRLSAQSGPRNTDRARALLALDVARAATGLEYAESKWLGRVVGAVAIDSADVRDALRDLVRTHADATLATETIVGVGVARPHDRVALDWVDSISTCLSARDRTFPKLIRLPAVQLGMTGSFADDPNANLRAGVLDAYAETAARDDARACAAWSHGIGTDAFPLRAAALLSVTPSCRAHHAAVLAFAEQRLAKDANDRSVSLLAPLCEGAEKTAFAKKVLAVATRVLPKVPANDATDALRAIGQCDARGPVAALRPLVARPGELGFSAKRVLLELTGHE